MFFLHRDGEGGQHFGPLKKNNFLPFFLRSFLGSLFFTVPVFLLSMVLPMIKDVSMALSMQVQGCAACCT